MFKLLSRLPLAAAIAAAVVVLVIGCVDSLSLAAPAAEARPSQTSDAR